MKKITESDFKQYISSAGMNTGNRVYPLSIVEGFQSGDVFVNDDDAVDSVFFWHYCGFGYITGKASNDFLNDIYALMMSGADRRLILITDDESVVSFFEDKDVQVFNRIEYRYAPGSSGTISYNSERFRIVPIDAGNFSEIKGNIIPAFSWKSNEQFLDKGFGFVAVEGDNICAVAFSAAVSAEEVDIGVETLEDYRGNGLASALAAKMCEQITSLGKKPVWAHAESNTGSGKTAVKCGFVEDRRNYCIRKK